ncbi:MAG: hypothetical protein WCO78_03790 [Candidatus Roizmanbacteria bacterium]
MRSRQIYLIAGLSLLFIIITVLVWRSYQNSLFVLDRNRILVGVWLGDESYVLSLPKESGQNHILWYPPSQEVTIPGGLKNYRLGALSKVAQLESDPRLYTKAMSQLSGIPLERTFYKNTQEVYYGDNQIHESISEITSQVRSSVWGLEGGSLWDKLFIYQKLGSLRSSNTELYIKLKPDKANLYDRIFRNEKQLVQMTYPGTPATAMFLSQLLEGIGIRVSDIGAYSNPVAKQCIVTEKTHTQSKTAAYITEYFGCAYKTGDTGLYEIQFALGSDTIEEWKL